MARGEWLFRFSWRASLAGAAVAAVLAFAIWRGTGSGLVAADDIETAEVVSGEFVEWVTLRGEVKAVRSVPIAAPSGAGELQIVALPKNGSEVKAGDTIVQFDTTTVERQLAEKRSLLRQAEAEIERAAAQTRLQEEGILTEQMKAQYEVERAKLDVGTRDVISRIEGEKAVLALADAEQKVREVEARLAATRAAARAELTGLEQKRDKARADVQLEERKLAALTLKAPVDGLITLGQNWRAGGGPFGAREWRAGDRAWPGSVIGELPELATPYVLAKIDEIDRGRLRTGLAATVTVEALPGVELPAKLAAFSTLAKPDYSSWPPPRMFDATVDLDAPDARLRPGMTGSIRVGVERIARTLLVPTRAIMQPGGAPYVYVRARGGFERRPVVVARRGPERTAVAEGLAAGEHVALEDAGKRER